MGEIKDSSAPFLIPLYKVYQSNNIFFFNGSVITGPNIYFLIFTYVVIIFTVAPVYPILYIQLENSVVLSIALVCLTLFFCFVLYFLTVTAFCDPGIIPKKNSVDLDVENGRVAFMVANVNGAIIKCYWCDNCKHFREPRSKHCHYCNNCVDKFDHHCVWIGNCVGSRNYRTFFFFLLNLAILSITILIIFLSLFLGRCLHEFDCINFESICYVCIHYPHIFLYLLYTLPGSLLLLNLFIYHVKLTLHNRTTYEDVQKLYADRNPFDEGKLTNVKKFLFTPTSKGLVNWKEIVRVTV